MPFSIRVAVLLISIFFNLLFVVTHGFLSNQGRKVRRNIYISVKSISTTATINTDSSNEESSDTAMTPFERLSRAVSFYSAAVPVFASYKILEQKFKLNPTDVESEEKEYQKIHEWGSEIMTEKIKELRGFYVKTGQIISTRVDIFPEQYTSKLAVTLDALDPVPAESIKEIVRNELLGGGDLSELFLEFEDEPLGSASIAQVHRAKLLDGRTVAVKVQRPGVDAKLLADIANLKTFAKIVGDSLPIDYYKIFCELEQTLKYELDFFHEAQSAHKIAAAVAHSPANKPRPSPVLVPLPLPGLVSRRVMVMEFIEGSALSKLSTEMSKRGVVPGSIESQLFGKKLLSALTDAYASMIFGSGIIHGDPHPGNIFVTPSGEVALLDCGQVKQLTSARRLALARLLVLINRWEKLSAVVADDSAALKEQQGLTTEIAQYMRDQGIDIRKEAGDECAVALALLLFGNSDAVLPGNFRGQELSPDSPIAQVINFPSEFILLGRATVMIKGIARRLDMEWGLCDRWSTYAREALATSNPSEVMPIWCVVEPSLTTTDRSGSSVRRGSNKGPIRFKEVLASLKSWFGLVKSYATGKFVQIISKYVPDSTKKTIFKVAIKVIAFFNSFTTPRTKTKTKAVSM